MKNVFNMLLVLTLAVSLPGCQDAGTDASTEKPAASGEQKQAAGTPGASRISSENLVECGAGTRVYTQPDLGFSLCYPQNWNIRESAESQSFLGISSPPESPDDAIVENLNFGYGAAEGMKLEAYFATYFAGLKNAVILKQGQEAHGNWKGQWVTFQLDNPGMILMHYVIAQQDEFLLISGAAEADKFENARAQFLQIIRSVRFSPPGS